MRLLLDTHALLWWFLDDVQLPGSSRALIESAAEVHVSAASAWEIATKRRIGKLDVEQAVERFDDLVERNGFDHLPISHRHALRAGGYDVAHRDPFDRMLAAQAELDGLALVTKDPAFGRFPVQVRW
ncbi:type II toxin-antitoxin system VapC family toxin [Luteipulveratus sp. YIM 133132]|uniref:Type II toxin-antitoxin system VapC family toxin n=1 Tax=Luteipulveratus flavus TaxID=3031728 RepID=A0ABT6C2I2_9MICO|nr:MULTISPECIES: type II toxin-antitoxin system VapC family toxin [unclassified Luteipulveratus]MDE9367161.1 type II toxin-antitoxin system VapC family toxin [Luteipulveratus sp. YIM 133132]MDF8263149.1 type II toxin-antitoxin system VapC family toxin [Luteipulveratus sp. YIM 133296]